jgi:hypothetical protein
MGRFPDQSQTMQPNPQQAWNDISFCRARVGELVEQSKLNGDLRPAQAALEELQLKTAHYEKLIEELQGPTRAVLGRNFLGIEEWRDGFGVHVGATPPIPLSITPELLNSPCPLHPGQKIKDTHILLLLPQTVNGQPFSPGKLDELYTARTGSEMGLIYDELTRSRLMAWANASPSASQWVLIPTSDPDLDRVSERKHFRGKSVAEQAEVFRHYKADYREAEVLEIVTAAFLNAVVNKEKILSDCFLRTVEHCGPGCRVAVGLFNVDGLRVIELSGALGWVGAALARRL